jgi:DNA-binding NarL/FixJ family response regulator
MEFTYGSRHLYNERSDQLIKILVAEEWDLLRKGLVASLQQLSQIQLFNAVTTTQEVLHLLQDHCPDILLLDVGLIDNGFSFLRIIKQQHPALPVVLLSTIEDPKKILQFIQHGANGYLLKKTCTNELLEAISLIMQGETFITRRVTPSLASHVAQAKSLKRM